MSSLLLRIAGPMQSWGIQSRFSERDTGREPSKSGIIGLICAAMGVSREDDETVGKLGRLRMGVRVDKEGRLMRDFHTAGGGKWPGVKKYGVIKADGSAPATVVSDRYYLADAVFLVALDGPRNLLEKIERALHEPVWPLFLGRKAFTPSEPLWLEDGLTEKAFDENLHSYRWLSVSENVGSLRLVLECPARGERECMDQPVSFAPGRRRYTVRHVKTDWAAVDNLGVE